MSGRGRGAGHPAARRRARRLLSAPPCSPRSSKLYFKNPDKADLGTYSVSVSDTEGVSSSFVLDEKGNAQGPRPACFRY